MATHGCVLRNGTLQSFDVPSSTFTQAWDINPGANIVGDFKDSAGVFHGFLQTGVHRHKNGDDGQYDQIQTAKKVELLRSHGRVISHASRAAKIRRSFRIPNTRGKRV